MDARLQNLANVITLSSGDKPMLTKEQIRENVIVTIRHSTGLHFVRGKYRDNINEITETLWQQQEKDRLEKLDKRFKNKNNADKN